MRHLMEVPPGLETQSSLLLTLFGFLDIWRVGFILEEAIEMPILVQHLPHVLRGDAHLALAVGLLTCQIQDFGGQVLKDTSQENRSGGAQALAIVTLPQEAVHMANRELKLCSGGSGDGLLLRLVAPTVFFPGHDA